MNELMGELFCVLGGHGFIGSSLVKEIKDRGGEVTSTPTKDVKAVFHFASYTHLPFEQNPAYHTHEIVSSFLYLLPFCEQYQIPFIYPSSALVYEQLRPFLHLKKTLEELVQIYNVRSVGLRIFPTYGVGEGERGHKTVIYQWVEQMLQGQRPTVYGDGTQSRDFIYISDVVDHILQVADSSIKGVIDIGSGEMVMFNDIVKIINEELKTELEPIYSHVPQKYAAGFLCPNPVETKVDIRTGIKKIIEDLR